MHAPITLSGKKYAVQKVYVLNKQVSKYVIMTFFSRKYSFTCTYWLWICVTMCAFCVFSIPRPLNTRLPLAGFNDKTKHGALRVLRCVTY